MNHTPAGRLIALEGKEGAEVQAQAGALKSALETKGYPCMISRWNTSNLFSALLEAQISAEQKIPLRTLSMFHAADLAHRINEMRSALQAGHYVIADQYLYTSVAIASALGADPAWIANLYAFAPEPYKSFYLTSNGEYAAHRTTSRALPKEGFGFYQFCSNLMTNHRVLFDPEDFERLVNRAFNQLVEQEKLKVIRSEAEIAQSISA
jgi:dTMP kinase